MASFSRRRSLSRSWRRRALATSPHGEGSAVVPLHVINPGIVVPQTLPPKRHRQHRDWTKLKKMMERQQCRRQKPGERGLAARGGGASASAARGGGLGEAPGRVAGALPATRALIAVLYQDRRSRCACAVMGGGTFLGDHLERPRQGPAADARHGRDLQAARRALSGGGGDEANESDESDGENVGDDTKTSDSFLSAAGGHEAEVSTTPTSIPAPDEGLLHALEARGRLGAHGRARGDVLHGQRRSDGLRWSCPSVWAASASILSCRHGSEPACPVGCATVRTVARQQQRDELLLEDDDVIALRGSSHAVPERARSGGEQTRGQPTSLAHRSRCAAVCDRGERRCPTSACEAVRGALRPIARSDGSGESMALVPPAAFQSGLCRLRLARCEEEEEEEVEKKRWR